MRIAAERENLPFIADFISDSMRKLGIAEGVLEVQLAVDEACTNIINYAYSEHKGSILLMCQVLHDNLVVTIQDTGRPFDPTSVVPPNLDMDLAKRKVGGLGMYLIRKMMDEVQYSFDRELGNKLVLRKKVNREM